MTTTLHQAVAQVLAAADAEIAAHQPVCRSSGRCCQFETYGHRLYVTGAELEYFAHLHAPRAPAAATGAAASGTIVSLPQFFARETVAGCPYQAVPAEGGGGLCTAREGRPLGCRVYFCDKDAQAWQNELYEKYHAQLAALHARYDLPYRYIEWRAALRELA